MVQCGSVWCCVVLCGVDINDNESGLFITTLPVVSRTEVGPAGTETVRHTARESACFATNQRAPTSDHLRSAGME